MKKIAVAFLTAFVFLFSAFFFAVPAKAYTNTNYYSDLKVGLQNMDAPSILVTLNGEYSFGDTVFPSGASFSLTISNGKVLLNGTEYDQISLVPSVKSSTMKLKVNNGVLKEYSFLGSMLFKVVGSGILPVNTVNIEDYLKGVVPYEMSDSYNIEALKAQAVAARNYILAYMGKYNSLGYTVDDTISYQVYRGYNPYYTNAIRAVNETKGVVLLYNEKLVSAYYSASNGGYTEESENVWVTSLPYLISKVDNNVNDMNYDWTATFSDSNVESTLKSKGYLSSTDKFTKINLDTISKYQSGRISNIEVDYTTSDGENKQKSFSKESARTFLGLKSSLYTVSYANGVYTFTGKGYGHGIGLSQVGANARGKAGQTFDSILGFYYDGTYLSNLRTRIDSFHVDKTKLLQGDTVALTSHATGGEAPVYKYIVNKGDSVVYTRDFSEQATASYTPQEAGNFSVTLYTKDKLSNEDYEASSTLNFSVYTQPQITNLTVSPSSPVEKSPISVKVQNSAGSLDGVEYKFEVLKDGSSVASQTTSNSTYSFTPGSYGSYVVKAYVKDKLSSKEYNDSRDITINVGKLPVVVKPSLSISGTLRKGSKGNYVNALQQALKNLGYYKSSIDGSFGNGTYSAVVAFQKSKGLKADGIVGSATVAKINAALQGTSASTPAPAPKPTQTQTQTPSAPANNNVVFSLSRTLRKGLRGNDVKALQQALKSLGFYKSTIDGAFGSGTYSAVTAFQRAKGLKADGIVGSGTAAKINEALKGTSVIQPSPSRGSTIVQPQTPPTSTGTKVSFTLSSTLRKGSRGNDVKALQQALKSLGYYRSSLDGAFGNGTYSAVAAFQRANGLKADGIVGSMTAKKINDKL